MLNRRNMHGQTALMLACKFGCAPKHSEVWRLDGQQQLRRMHTWCSSLQGHDCRGSTWSAQLPS